MRRSPTSWPCSPWSWRRRAAARAPVATCAPASAPTSASGTAARSASTWRRARSTGRPDRVRLAELATPALVADADLLDGNLRTMSAALPGARLRPHVKAHKSTALAKLQAALGHRAFTCATVREMEGMAAAGLGDDLLLANEVLDARRLGVLDARVTVAVDSEPTLEAAARGGVREVLIDVNVGLPRCGCAPEAAGRLADRARGRGLSVRGVMGYEGHLMGVEDRVKRAGGTSEAMALLARAHADVGGEVI